MPSWAVLTLQGLLVDGTWKLTTALPERTESKGVQNDKEECFIMTMEVIHN